MSLDESINSGDQEANLANSGSDVMSWNQARNQEGDREEDTLNQCGGHRVQVQRSPILPDRSTTPDLGTKVTPFVKSSGPPDLAKVASCGDVNKDALANNDTKALRSEAQNFNQQIHNSKDYSPRPSSNLKLPSDENTAANDASTKMKDPDQNNTKLLSKQKLGELLSWVDPSGKLDPNVEELLSDIADDFVSEITERACKLASHRNSGTVAIRDFRLPLEIEWNINVVGFTFAENEPEAGQAQPLSRDL